MSKGKGSRYSWQDGNDFGLRYKPPTPRMVRRARAKVRRHRAHLLEVDQHAVESLMDENAVEKPPTAEQILSLLDRLKKM